MGLKIDECTRQNLCADCDDESCIRHGDPGQDCPKYHCDIPEPRTLDCENCPFLKRYQEDMREFYRRENEQGQSNSKTTD